MFYISIVYDSPYVPIYSYTIIYPTNYVFLFDKQEYLKFKNMGINTVYYTVLPVNSTIIDFLNQNAVFPNVMNMGVAGYYSEMPYVFSHSKIKLTIIFLMKKRERK